MDPKHLHSFVSRQPIKCDKFERKLIKLLFVLSQSSEMNGISKKIMDDFQKKMFCQKPEQIGVGYVEF